MAMLLDSFADLLVEKLGGLIAEEVAILCAVKGDLEVLRSKLNQIKDVLEDAERKSFHEPSLRRRTNQLRDVMHEADDIIDEFQTKQLLVRNRSIDPSSSSSSCCSCVGNLALHHQIGRRIRSINRRLPVISSAILQYQLVRATYNSRSSSIGRDSRISHTTSPLVESDTVGARIEVDTKKLVDRLTKGDVEKRGVLVLAIAGIGGIGKTTLAQRIYNDPDTKSTFPIRVWVCVSKEVSEVNLLKEILVGAARVNLHDIGLHNRALLEPMVENALAGKKFLLVLDDMWSAQAWEDLLRNPLQKSASGSRVLVTTRNEGVALRMKTIDIHRVELLPPDEGWSLMCKKVASNGEESELEGLKGIGLEIVKKCDGLPLAIKCIGGVLCTKDRSERAWKEVLQNTSWSLIELPDGIKGALYLSYEDLPPHLKECFLYFSLFPEDHLFFESDLVKYWISEGFVRAEGGLALEDTASGYYKELVQRSFLQPDIYYYDNKASKMHDLLHLLAGFLTQGESLVMHKGLRNSSNLLPTKPHRISVLGLEDEELRALVNLLKKNKSLRTLISFDSHMGDENVVDVIRTFKRLRVLKLLDSVIEKLPYSVGNLVHLRQLDLSGSNIRDLPNSIVNLVNLEYMILKYCKNLHNLSDHVVKLHKLRYVNIAKTSIRGMPVGLGSLQHLNRIVGFVVNNENNRSSQRQWGSLEELKSLSMLRGLTVHNLERTFLSNEEATKGGGHDLLKSNQHLSELKLYCTQQLDDGAGVDEEEMKRIREVFDLFLCPPPGLDILKIKGFYGINFPSWMAPSLLPNLRWLKLKDCHGCVFLPPLGNLPNLDSLKIEGARSIIIVGPEFLGQKSSAIASSSSSSSSTSLVLFPKLTYLEFTDMPNWEKWEWEEEDNVGMKKEAPCLSVLPCLQELVLQNCPKLRSLPVGLGRNATFLTEMTITHCGSLTKVSSFPFLKELNINMTRNLDNVSDLPALQHLELTDYEMESLPEWLLGEEQHFPALQKLDIQSNDKLLQRCLEERGPEWSKIQQFSSVYGHDYHRSKYFSYTRRSLNPSVITNLLDDDDDDGSGIKTTI